MDDISLATTQPAMHAPPHAIPTPCMEAHDGRGWPNDDYGSPSGETRLVKAAAARLRDATRGKIAVVVGGGFSGLACACELAAHGVAVLILDTSPPGYAPASSAAAGLLDAVSPKGRLMWRGHEAYAAARALLDQAAGVAASAGDAVRRPPATLYSLTGMLHIPSTDKQAAQYAEAADACGEAVGLGLRFLDSAGASALAPGARLPRGGLLSPHGLVVDSGSYLRALWDLIRARAPAAEWLPRRVASTHLLCRMFDLVILAPGAGALRIEETRHAPIDLSRGQVLEYDASDPYLAAEPQPELAAEPDPNPATEPQPEPAVEPEPAAATVTNTTAADANDHAAIVATTVATTADDATKTAAAATEAAAAATEAAAATTEAAAATTEAAAAPTEAAAAAMEAAAAAMEAAAAATDTLGGAPPLEVALTGAIYVLPVRGVLVCGGTYEPTQDAAQLDPPSVDFAEAALRPALLQLYPPASRLGPPRRARAGVRALPPRSSAGAIPLAGRAHAAGSNVWFVCGMGSRGLLYHALVARWLVRAALADDPACIPTELRRGEFSELLRMQLLKLLATDPLGAKRTHRGWQREPAVLEGPVGGCAELTSTLRPCVHMGGEAGSAVP